MRKIFVSLLSILFTISILIGNSSSIPSKVFAADYTNCQCQRELQNGNFTCGGNAFTCNGTDVCTTNWNETFQNNNNTYNIACVPKAQTGITCTCNNSGKAGAGNNGMTCRDSQGALSYPIFCSDSSFACINGSDKNIYLGEGIAMVEGRGKTDYDTRFKNHFATGVACESPQMTVRNTKISCSCVTPNVYEDKKNGFVCTGQGKDNSGNNYVIYCDDSDAACVEGADKSVVMDEANVMVEGRNSDYDTNFKKRTATGVSCEREEPSPFPTQPPPPSPPCTEGKWLNGRCTSFITAVGELKTDTISFTTRLFAILLSFSGGIALLLIIRSGYNMITSRGNPQKVQDARDQFTAAIVGLVFLIFSFVLLQVIGYDILRIPGFGDRGGGSPCSSDSQCPSGYACGYTTGNGGATCQRVNGATNNSSGFPVGSTCTSALQCQRGLVCNYNGSARTCQTPATGGLGSPCNGSADCASGLSCGYNGSSKICQ